MFSISRNDQQEAKVTSPTISEIARAVPVGTALQMAEKTLGGYRRQREVVGAELNAAYASRRGERGGATGDIDLLTAELATVEAKINGVRGTAMELRRARAERVSAALAPVRQNAAQRLIAATEELDRAFRDLRESCEEIRRAGDPEQPYFQPPAIGVVLDLALSIVRAAK